MRATDDFLEAAARVRTLTVRELDRIAADRRLERREKIAAVQGCLDRCKYDLEDVAAAATSPSAEHDRRMTLERAAFGMPADAMAAFVELEDDAGLAATRMGNAFRNGDVDLAKAIAAEAWLRCLDGRRTWVQVVSGFGDQSSTQGPLVNALLSLLSERDRTAEILSFVPPFPAAFQSESSSSNLIAL